MSAACTAKYHDTYSAAHNHGCICPRARIEAARRSSLYADLHRRGIRLRVPALGTIRRIQALQVMGYSTMDLKAMLGRSANNKANLYPRNRHGSGMVQPSTAARWMDLYERICMTPASGPRANHIRAMARNKGWAGPLEWDDIDDPTEVPYWQTEEGRAERERQWRAAKDRQYRRARRTQQQEQEAA